ncbi:uncharacterized protein YagA-like [Macrobrachium rosenbergii]|uniref:uncharacterized protein YagA-like n=1 Tax=Macrobrachium rosenbergii TaxID=79674 RepID=UPI0034D63E4B
MAQSRPYDGGISIACASAFLSPRVSRFGIPNHITSDRGTTFMSQLWTSLNCLLGTQLHHATTYHPESNDMVERFHRTLKAGLMPCCNFLTWYSQLPRVLLGLRTTPKEGLDLSAAEMVYGNPLVIPAKFFSDNNTSPDIIRLRTIIGKFAHENSPLTTHPISQMTRPLSPGICILQHTCSSKPMPFNSL